MAIPAQAILVPDTSKSSIAGSDSVFGALSFIFQRMSSRDRRHFYATVALMLLGAVAEVMAIGAVLPFLASMSGGAGGNGAAGLDRLADLAAIGASGPPVLLATLALVALTVAAAIIRLGLAWATQSFVFRVGHDVGVEIYARMLRQPYSYHVQRHSSEVIAGMEKVQQTMFAVLLPLMQGAVALVIAIGIIAILIVIDPVIAAAAALALAALYLAVSIVSRRLLRRNSGLISVRHNERVRLIQEGLGGIRDILIDQSQPVFEESFRRLDHQLRRAQMLNVFVAQAPRFIVEAAGIILIALLAAYMSSRSGGVLAALPVIGTLAFGAQRLLPLLQLVYLGWSHFVGSAGLLLDVVALLRAPVVPGRPRRAGEPPLPFAREIQVDGVSYQYPGGAEVLHDLSLTVSKGERLGLLGKTGSGKSTLQDLLMGLLEPSAGRILVDGRILDDQRRADWQGQVAHVPQAIFLADTGIAANIAFGEARERIDLERVREAARRARIDDFIQSLPDGYDSRVGERGVRLSGGQRQRIGIARALYRRPSVLFLDEATSALDDETEAGVMSTLSTFGRDLTIFMIAHRLSSLAGCDRLVRLDAGRIVQIGSFDEIVGTAGHGRAALNG
jgi:ATP-binding cassette, subfamily B, bacterial PglK